MRRIGEAKSYEECIEVPGGEARELVVDPVELAGRRITDWDGYVAAEGAGTVEVYRDVGGIRVQAASAQLEGEPWFYVLRDTVRYAVVASAGEGGAVRACVRLNFYG